MIYIIQVILLIFLLIQCSFSQQEYVIKGKLVAYISDRRMCEDTSIGMRNANSCSFIHNGITFKKNVLFKVNDSCLVDSVYWYGSPMGVYKMDISEYEKVYENKTGETSCKEKRIVVYQNSAVKDGCNIYKTFKIDTLNKFILVEKENKYMFYLLE